MPYIDPMGAGDIWFQQLIESSQSMFGVFTYIDP